MTLSFVYGNDPATVEVFAFPLYSNSAFRMHYPSDGNLDQNSPNHHPSSYWDSRVEETWQDRLIWSGAESCEGHYNGYIEGAIITSRATLKLR